MTILLMVSDEAFYNFEVDNPMLVEVVWVLKGYIVAVDFTYHH